jgi:hypothetical protein
LLKTFDDSAEDNPNTRDDETGRYSFSGVEPGFYVLSEVVPDGYRQTFPWGIAIDPLPGGPPFPFEGQSHFVVIPLVPRPQTSMPESQIAFGRNKHRTGIAFAGNRNDARYRHGIDSVFSGQVPRSSRATMLG